MVTKIYLRNIVKDGVNCLAMRDSNNNEGINELETEVPSGSKVKWILLDESGIKSISRIWSIEKKSKVFKKEPQKMLLQKVFKVEAVVSDIEIREKYNIKYITDDGTDVIIDPWIRIKPT